MTSCRLPSIDYEPPGEPSLFERWEAGDDTGLRAPLAVRDPAYRRQIVDVFDDFLEPGRRLISVGAGNGYVEAALEAAGWNVLATDRAESALARCRVKGLATARFALMEDAFPGRFDAVYCDGVMGHFWEPGSGLRSSWNALADLGRPGSIAVVSNDLADDDEQEQFAVQSSVEARFYRPPSGTFGIDAKSTGRWSVESARIYDYLRSGATRRREIVVLRLLVNEGIETEDGPEFSRGDRRLIV